ncbi:hypothetical protein DM877_23030 [Enterobacter cloacae]|uniref:Uncharacterized protein n=1 Tax=Enterobacter cloacae TaxID=550 RepID=A0A4Q2E1R5_ENTCL|nr:hypothetical protein DM877_23030 [Enterobacter cloacae]
MRNKRSSMATGAPGIYCEDVYPIITDNFDMKYKEKIRKSMAIISIRKRDFKLNLKVFLVVINPTTQSTYICSKKANLAPEISAPTIEINRA